MDCFRDERRADSGWTSGFRRRPAALRCGEPRWERIDCRGGRGVLARVPAAVGLTESRGTAHARCAMNGKGGTEMRASALSFRTAIVFGLAGMALGIFMAASRDHSSMPAHARLNLLGWVSLFLFGIYYRLNSALDVSRLALVQVGVWSLGTVVLTIGVAAIHMGYAAADPIAGVGSLLVLGAMVLFAALVFRPTLGTRRTATILLTPAE